jgi:hypothetical protein
MIHANIFDCPAVDGNCSKMDTIISFQIKRAPVSHFGIFHAALYKDG